MKNRVLRLFFLIVLATSLSLLIAAPPLAFKDVSVAGRTFSIPVGLPKGSITLLGKTITTDLPFKQGLDIQGGMQVVLEADMSSVAQEDKVTALDSARAVILRRVDLYGISEPIVQTSQVGDSYRIIVELPGVEDPGEALQLVGQTAQLQFMLVSSLTPPADMPASIAAQLQPQVEDVGLGGSELQRASLSFNQQTREPEIALQFNSSGAETFGKVTTEHTGETLGIFLDGAPLMLPTIQSPILTGQAVITGQFTVEEAKQLAIQLNAGALPVPISVLEQRTIGASLGQQAIRQSVIAGLIGLAFVLVFMVLLYGWQGVIADMALVVYAVLTLAIYKLAGITLSLPGIAGLLLSIGMAVDANILIFERMKEEWRKGKPHAIAMELGFGRAWDSIKDANAATILTALILINPLNFSFLNSSGLVRGFGVTLLIGVVLGLFTGVLVTRTFVRLFLKAKHD
ncbi:protein translocase subunit SecD [Candidatus Woesebacteria bacterium]|nr:protein translocase subunit SecD [Candidatus Woesebacteria bacterium]